MPLRRGIAVEHFRNLDDGHLPGRLGMRAVALAEWMFEMAQRLIVAIAWLLPVVASAAGQLENPQPGSRESGIGIVSGWYCSAGRIDIEFDGGNLSINGNIQTNPAFSCGYTGTHTLLGPQHAAAGTFTCTNGKQGNWRTTEFQITERGLSPIGEGDWTQQGVSCRMKFLLGGYRHLPLP